MRKIRIIESLSWFLLLNPLYAGEAPLEELWYGERVALLRAQHAESLLSYERAQYSLADLPDRMAHDRDMCELAMQEALINAESAAYGLRALGVEPRRGREALPDGRLAYHAVERHLAGPARELVAEDAYPADQRQLDELAQRRRLPLSERRGAREMGEGFTTEAASPRIEVCVGPIKELGRRSRAVSSTAPKDERIHLQETLCCIAKDAKYFEKIRELAVKELSETARWGPNIFKGIPEEERAIAHKTLGALAQGQVAAPPLVQIAALMGLGEVARTHYLLAAERRSAREVLRRLAMGTVVSPLEVRLHAIKESGEVSRNSVTFRWAIPRDERIQMQETLFRIAQDSECLEQARELALKEVGETARWGSNTLPGISEEERAMAQKSLSDFSQGRIAAPVGVQVAAIRGLGQVASTSYLLTTERRKACAVLSAIVQYPDCVDPLRAAAAEELARISQDSISKEERVAKKSTLTLETIGTTVAMLKGRGWL